jgi:TctA family transporter
MKCNASRLGLDLRAITALMLGATTIMGQVGGIEVFLCSWVVVYLIFISVMRYCPFNVLVGLDSSRYYQQMQNN